MSNDNKKMDVKYWEGGLTLHEVKAIEKIAQAFSGANQKQVTKPARLGSLSDLKVLKSGGNAMFPWKGYAGFRLAGAGREGEFDLVIVTHYNVIIVELKHWNGELTASGDNWYQNGEFRERSAVSKTQDKAHLLTSKLAKCGRAFPSFQGHKFDRPKVDFLVVLTGTADASKLPPREQEHVLTLSDFLQLSDEGAYKICSGIYPGCIKHRHKYRFCRNHYGISHVLRDMLAFVLGKAANERKSGWFLPETVRKLCF